MLTVIILELRLIKNVKNFDAFRGNHLIFKTVVGGLAEGPQYVFYLGGGGCGCWC